jgi:hypothetical protein
MKMTNLYLVVGLALSMAFSALLAGVSVDTNQPAQKVVAFRVLTNKFITTQSPSLLDCTGDHIGSKQKFMIIDMNGGPLTDGHQIRIRYTPSNSTKSSYWREVKEGVKRGSDGDPFKIHRVDTKCALETVSGNFVSVPTTNGLLSVTNKLEDAMLIELVDLSSLASGAKMPHDLPTLTVAPSAESSTNQPAATADSATAH